MGCPQARTATIVLRGGSEQFIDEADRSLHDAIMIVRRALKHSEVVPGGGAIEMEVRQWRGRASSNLILSRPLPGPRPPSSPGTNTNSYL